MSSWRWYLMLTVMLSFLPTIALAQSQGSAAAGAATFRHNCSTCHSTTPTRTIIGPSLFGVFNRRAGTLPNYPYSPAMIASGITWDEDNIKTFIAAPSHKVEGTKMTFTGLTDADQRQDVVAYLKSLQ